MTAREHLFQLLRGRWFRRLLAVRVTSQFADGVFQVALASYVLFSPDRQPTPGAIAGALAVVTLPFSLLGPFAGVLLDRWARRQVLVYANLLRLVLAAGTAGLVSAGVPDPVFYAAVLATLSVNRFVLAGLSASLPHTVSPAELVGANAVSPTVGAIAAFAGAGAGTVVRRLADDPGVLLTSSLLYGVAALLALRMPRDLLGPDVDPARPGVADAARHVVRGLAAGLHHLRQRPVAAYALRVIAVHRVLFGLGTVAAVLLFRNRLHAGDADAAFDDLALLVAAAGAGFVLAALVTPSVVDRVGTRTWILSLLAGSAAVQVYPTLLFTREALWVAGLGLALGAQGIKICVDTLVQVEVDDAFRGRVFSVYDVLFNVAFVSAAAVGALVLPDDGHSYAVLAAVAVGYALTACWYATTPRAPAPGPALT